MYELPPIEHHFSIPAPLASILKFPPPKEAHDLIYAELVCTNQDRADIYELIATMGKENKASLLMETVHLKKIGHRIEHVHPMKLLSTLLSPSDRRKEMKEHLGKIFSDSFKRWAFMDGAGFGNGLALALDREAARGTLLKYLPDFARELALDEATLAPFIHQKNWEGLVKWLIKTP